jgi:hypothetical protein
MSDMLQLVVEVRDGGSFLGNGPSAKVSDKLMKHIGHKTYR